MIRWAVKAGDVNLATYLLRQNKPSIGSLHLLQDAARNEKQPWKLLDTLLKEGMPPMADEGTLEVELLSALTAALANPISDGQLVAKLYSAMTTKLVLSLGSKELVYIAKNRERGAEILQTLLDFKSVVVSPGFIGSFEVIKTAFANSNSKVLKLLFTSKLLLGAYDFDGNSVRFGEIVTDASEEHFLDDIRRKGATIVRSENGLGTKNP